MSERYGDCPSCRGSGLLANDRECWLCGSTGISGDSFINGCSKKSLAKEKINKKAVIDRCVLAIDSSFKRTRKAVV